MANMGFEGFDAQNDYHMSAKEQRKENWEQSKIWIALGVVMAICLVITVYMSARDILLVMNGNCVEAKYDSSNACATIHDENGKNYTISTGDLFITSDKSGIIKVYYYGDNISSAKPVTAWQYWLVMYCIWIPLLGLCIFFTYRNIKGK